MSDSLSAREDGQQNQFSDILAQGEFVFVEPYFLILSYANYRRQNG